MDPVTPVSLSTGELLTFGLLTVALARLWLPTVNRSAGDKGRHWADYPWVFALVAAACCGLLFDLLEWQGLLAVIAMGGASWGVYRQGLPGYVRAASAIGVVVLALGLALHLIPGFNNPKVISDVVLSPGAVPYSKYLNFDKAIIGLFLLAFGQQLIGRWREWKEMFGRTLPVAAVTIGAVLVLSFALGYVRFEPAVPPHFLLWAWTNLFFTCMAEEAIFRGFIQQGLERGLAGKRFGGVAALATASVLFGLAHWTGGPKYILLSTVAGFGYGITFRRSGRIEGSIATHFALNALHFSFFTYPALASAVT